MFTTYPIFERTFSASVQKSDKGKDGLDDQEIEDAFAKAKAQHPHKVCQQLIDFLYDVMSGLYDEPIKSALKAASGDIKECNWMDTGGFETLRDIFRLLNQHRNVVEATVAEAMPTAGPRTLARISSEAGDDAEKVEELRQQRAEAWRLAQIARKKLAFISSGKIVSKADLQQLYEKTPAFNSFEGKPGEKHRVFVFSAELLQESRSLPWSTTAEWNGSGDIFYGLADFTNVSE